MLDVLQVATQGAAQLGVVLLLGSAWALAVLGPGLAAARDWRRRVALLATAAWLALMIGSLGSLPLTLQRVLGRWDLQLVRSFAAGTDQGEAVLQRCALATAALALTLLALWLGGRAARALSVTALLAGVALVDTLSRVAHAAVMQGAAYRLLDVVHLYVAGAWGGGLIALALWPWRRPPPETAATVERALRRHSLTGMLAVVTLALSGVLAAQSQLPAAAALTTTPYGIALSVKLALVAATLLAAAYNRWRLLPRLLAAQGGGGERMALGIRLEALLLLAVLLATALLTTRPPPHEML